VTSLSSSLSLSARPRLTALAMPCGAGSYGVRSGGGGPRRSERSGVRGSGGDGGGGRGGERGWRLGITPICGAHLPA